jgi:hypothetical protein
VFRYLLLPPVRGKAGMGVEGLRFDHANGLPPLCNRADR